MINHLKVQNSIVDLKVEANIVHVKSWHTQALDPHSFSLLPVVMDVIQHVVSDSTLSLNNTNIIR